MIAQPATDIDSRWTRFYLKLAVLWIASLGAAILRYPMSWGLMDDGQNLAYIRSGWKSLTFLEVMRQYSTINWFRPVYTSFVYAGYHVFLHNPKAFYFFNYLLVLSAFLPWGLLLRRHVSSAFAKSSFVLFCLLLLAATPLYNLFVYLSLQEKFVILFGGWSFLALDYSLRRTDGRLWWLLQGAAYVCFVLGMWSKPTMMAFAPWIILALLAAPGVPNVRRWIAGALWGFTTACLARIYLRRSDSYSGRFSLNVHAVLDHARSQPKLSFVCLALATVLILWIAIEQCKEFPERRPESFLSLAWPTSLIAYLVVLLPWGIATYLWAPAMVLACGTIVLLVDRFSIHGPAAVTWVRHVLLAGACASATIVLWRIAIPRLARQSEIGQTVGWLASRLPQEDTDLFVLEPCQEAAWSLQYQSGGKQMFHYALRGQAITPAREQAWLITRDECAMDSSHESQFPHVIYQSPHWTIYSTDRPK